MVPATTGQLGPQFAPVVLTYGHSGSGKTVDLLYTFPNAAVLAAPGATNASYNLIGFQPQIVPIQAGYTMEHLVHHIPAIAASGRFDAVIVDDLSFLATQTVMALEGRFHGWKLWGEIKRLGVMLRDQARFLGVGVGMNTWLKPPSMKDGKPRRGGPELPGSLPEAIPAMADLVLRCSWNEERRPWGGEYHGRASSTWIGKDRNHGIADPSPMNLRAILTVGGYRLSRLPGLEWQDGVMHQLADAVKGASPAEVAQVAEQVYKGLLSQNHDPRHVRWAVRDGLDLGELLRAKTQRESSFFGPAPVATGAAALLQAAAAKPAEPAAASPPQLTTSAPAPVSPPAAGSLGAVLQS